MSIDCSLFHWRRAIRALTSTLMGGCRSFGHHISIRSSGGPPSFYVVGPSIWPLLNKGPFPWYFCHMTNKECVENLAFCIKFEDCLWQKYHSVDHKALIFAVRTSFHHLYKFKEGYGILKQQCVSLLIAQHPIFHAERVPKIWCFAWNLRGICAINYTVVLLNGLYML